MHLKIQNNELRLVALTRSTNFYKSLGPTVPFPASQLPSWSGLIPPLPNPLPNFDLIVAQQKPDDNWAPAYLAGEVIPATRRLQGLYPLGGFAAPGICDSWHRFVEEPMNVTSVAFMTDLVPSMSDTLLRIGGLFDAHMFREGAEKWASENPGTTCPFTNTIAQVRQSSSQQIEFSRHLESFVCSGLLI